MATYNAVIMTNGGFSSRVNTYPAFTIATKLSTVGTQTFSASKSDIIAGTISTQSRQATMLTGSLSSLVQGIVTIVQGVKAPRISPLEIRWKQANKK